MPSKDSNLENNAHSFNGVITSVKICEAGLRPKGSAMYLNLRSATWKGRKLKIRMNRNMMISVRDIDVGLAAMI